MQKENSTTKQNSNSKLVEIEKIKNTPFTAIKHENKWYLTLGKYRLTEGKRTLRETIKDSKNASWDRLMQIIQIMIDENKKQLVEDVIDIIKPVVIQETKNHLKQ